MPRLICHKNIVVQRRDKRDFTINDYGYLVRNRIVDYPAPLYWGRHGNQSLVVKDRLKEKYKSRNSGDWNISADYVIIEAVIDSPFPLQHGIEAVDGYIINRDVFDKT